MSARCWKSGCTVCCVVTGQVASDILKKLPAVFDMDKTRKMFGISISPTTVVLLQVNNSTPPLSLSLSLIQFLGSQNNPELVHVFTVCFKCFIEA